MADEGRVKAACRKIVTSAVSLGERFRARMPWLGDAIVHLVQVRIMDSSTVLAAKGFTALVPVLFVVAAFSPSDVRGRLQDSVRSALGLGGASMDQVTSLLSARDGELRQAYGLLGILIVLVSATSFSRSLQGMCERSWHLTKAGTRVAVWRWFAWLSVFLVYLLVGGAVRDWLGAPGGYAPAGVVSVLFWWWTQHLLLAGRVGWSALLPGAVLAGISLAVWLLISRVYVPEALNRSIAQYGPLGSVFTILSWLLACTSILTVSVALGYLIARLPPFNRWLHVPA